MRADVVIVGGGLAGMTAAYEAVSHGLAPVVVETRGRPGGLIASATLDDITFDIGAESWATRSTVIGALVDELGLDVTEPTGRSWIYNQSTGNVYPIPDGSLGLPADIDAPEILAAIGPEGVARAKEDLTMDPLIGADVQDLGSLVETRLGRAVAENLVEPVAGGIHASSIWRLSADSTIPGLRALMNEKGSLLAANAELTRRHPGPKVSQTTGGMFRLIEALESAILAGSGQIYVRHAVTALQHEGTDWRVQVQPTVRGANPSADPIPQGEGFTVDTARVVIALPGTHAMSLLKQSVSVPTWELPLGSPLAHMVLMLDAPSLDEGPRGSGVLVTDTPHDRDESTSAHTKMPLVRAKALTHLSYKWGWMRDVLPAGHHLLRLSYGRNGEEYPEPSVDSALEDTNHLLGTSLTRDQVLRFFINHWDGQLAPQTPQHREHVTELQDVVAGIEGLEVTGAWVAGSGFAAVVPHAREAIHHLLAS